MTEILLYHILITAPGPLKVTHTGPGSIMTEFTADPAGNDVAFYRVYISSKSCSVPAGNVPLRCEITGLEEGKNHYLQAKACYSDNVCGYSAAQYVDAFPRGKLLGDK